MKFEVYKDTKGEWRWRLYASNGNVVADSAEGYINKIDCVKMIDHIIRAMSDTSISVQEG